MYKVDERQNWAEAVKY